MLKFLTARKNGKKRRLCVVNSVLDQQKKLISRRDKKKVKGKKNLIKAGSGQQEKMKA